MGSVVALVLACSVSGLRRNSAVVNSQPAVADDPEPTLLALGAGQAEPEPVFPAKNRYTWRTGELVGWVGEGNLVKVGDHGTITRLHDASASVRYSNSTVWRHYISELYKVVATGYGFKGGQRTEFIRKDLPVAYGQMGIVQAFSENSRKIRWYDLRQKRSAGVTPEMIRALSPYSPNHGNGAWVPLHSVYAGSEIRELIGTAKSNSETKTQSWSNSVTATLSAGMQGGVEFDGASAGVSVGIELSSTLSRQHSSAVSYSWSSSIESEYTLPFSQNGFLWQWMIRTELENLQVLTSKTREFAVTTGAWVKPRCLPGYKTDGLAHQVCKSSDSQLF